MAKSTPGPVGQFNFLVDLGGSSSDSPRAGFQEVSGLDLEGSLSEGRTGTGSESVTKITGLNKATDVTMKRGVVGARDFDRWLDDIRKGNQNARRTITIQQQNEDHRAVVRTWRLIGARIIKHTSGPFNAKGTDVAIEELVLTYERLERKDERP